jgi:hypothetical protein
LHSATMTVLRPFDAALTSSAARGGGTRGVGAAHHRAIEARVRGARGGDPRRGGAGARRADSTGAFTPRSFIGCRRIARVCTRSHPRCTRRAPKLTARCIRTCRLPVLLQVIARFDADAQEDKRRARLELDAAVAKAREVRDVPKLSGTQVCIQHPSAAAVRVFLSAACGQTAICSGRERSEHWHACTHGRSTALSSGAHPALVHAAGDARRSGGRIRGVRPMADAVRGGGGRAGCSSRFPRLGGCAHHAPAG